MNLAPLAQKASGIGRSSRSANGLLKLPSTIAGVTAASALAATMWTGSSALANEVGHQPSTALPVQLGSTYFGNLDQYDERGDWISDVWRLPPLMLQDRVTVAANASATFAIGGNVDDFNWQSPWGNLSDHPDVRDRERIYLTARRSCGVCFLEVGEPGPAGDNGPYDFTVEAIQHKVGLALNAVTSVKRKGRVAGSAVLTNSAPVPDGTTISLIVTKGSARWVYTAHAAGGRLSFKVALPKSLKGKKVKLRLYRSATTTIQAGSSSSIKARIR